MATQTKPITESEIIDQVEENDTTYEEKIVLKTPTSDTKNLAPIKIQAGATKPMAAKPLPRFKPIPKIAELSNNSSPNYKTALGQSVTTTSASPKKSPSPKSNCTACNKEYTTKTLDANNGVCGRCVKKADGNTSTKTGAKKTTTTRTVSEKSKCGDCDKEFTTKTLDKYGGICGKCNNKVNGAEATKAASGSASLELV